MIKFMLNPKKMYNYAFFCPVSRMHLTVSSPVGFASEVTSAILKGLKSKAIIDVDNVVDLETGKIKVKETNTSVDADKKEDNDTVNKKEEKQEKKSPKRGKKAETKIIDEASDVNE